MKNRTTLASIGCILFLSLVSWSQQTIAPIAANLAPPSPSVLWEKEPFGSRPMTKELVGSRDQFSKHFQNEDGTITAHIAAGPIHYFENGQWQTIYHSIVPNGNGFENIWNSHKTYYPKQATGAIQTVLPSGQNLTDMIDMRMYFEQNGQAVGVKQIQPKNGSAQFNELTYAGVYGNGIDLRLTHNSLNRKMDYIIQSTTALGIIPSGATHLIFEEKAQLPTGWTAVLVDNEILLKDAAGVVQAKYEKPVFNDSPVHNHEEGETITEEGHDHHIFGDYVIQQTGNTLTIKTKVPLNWLLDEHRAFPVVVDPTTDFYPNNTSQWTGHIRTDGTSPDAYTTTSNTTRLDNNMIIGRGTGTTANNVVHHPWIKFNIATLPYFATINSASLRINAFSTTLTGTDCYVNVSINPLANDPVPATNPNLLIDIRDGATYSNVVFTSANTTTGWHELPLGGAVVADLYARIVDGWFGVGMRSTDSRWSPTNHYDYFSIRPHSSSDRPVLRIVYTIPPPEQVAANITVGPVRDAAGLGTPLLPNANISTPTEYPDHESWRGRLFNPISVGGYQWYDTYAGGGHWQVDLGSIKNVNGIITQGRTNSHIPVPPSGQLITSVDVTVSADGSTWIPVGSFNTNTDHNTAITSIFPNGPVSARFVRIQPTNAIGGYCMRADVLSIPCGSGTHQVSFSAQLPLGIDHINNTIRWYDSPTGGTLLGTGLYITRSISQSATIYAATYHIPLNAESARVPVTGIVGSPPQNPTITQSPANPTCGAPVTLTAENPTILPEPRPNLVAHYPFYNNLNDVSGNNLHLSGTGNFNNGGLNLTGATHSSVSTDILDTDNHTISYYIKFTTNFDNTWNHKIFGYNPPTSDRSPGLWRNINSNRIHWRYSPGNTGYNEYSTPELTIDEWYHVVGVKDGGTFRYYLNGTLVATEAVSDPKTPGVAPLVFGQSAGTILREFKIFDRALSTAEIGRLAKWQWYEGSCGGSLVGTGPQITVTPSVNTTYFLQIANDCGVTSCASVAISMPSTAPTAITAVHPNHPNYCHGNNISLTATGGAIALDAQTVWYQGGCNNAYTEPWVTTSSWDWSGATTLNSVNGILNLTSTSNDPMISMPNLGSFNPAVYRYINVRYRVTAGTAGGMEIFFYNTASPVAIGAHYTGTPLISDNQWHIATLDLYQNALYTTGGNITGWRYDWATAPGVTMELDFIQLSQFPMIDENTTDDLLTLTPGAAYYPAAGTTTYAAARIDNCGATTCASTTVTLPTAGSTLGLNGESATCLVNQNGWVHFYHSSGRLIGSINSQGQNLGNVTMTVYVDGTNQQVPACDDPTNPSFFTAVMQRHWVVNDNPVGALTPNIQVGVPFYNTELSNLVSASGSNVNPTDNVAAIGDVLMSRYHGPANVDHIAINNCTQNGGNENTVIHSQNWNGPTTDYSAVTGASYIVYTVPEFSELWLHGQSDISPLPVELSAFNALCEENQVRVEWLTASEQNSSHFVIEKSRDGLTWQELGTLQAAGNANTANFYHLNDYNASGLTYYRMQQIDLDGVQKTYGPISTNCGEKTDALTVYPNPSSGEFSVQLVTEQLSTGSTIAIYDLTGKQVYAFVQDIQPGTTTHMVQPNTLARGTYTIRVENTNGNFQPVKLVIQ